MATKSKRGLLGDYIPLPAGEGHPQTPGPRAGLGGTVNMLSYGLGTGMRNQLAGLLDMAQHPMQYGNALLQAAMHPSQSLPAIGNALADQYRMATSGAAGFGQVLGENISPRGLLGVTAAAAKKPIMREAVAYHGSPHNFDEFKLSKETIGTGEGAQVYGHGLYFSESPDVAGQYAANVKDMGTVNRINQEMAALANVMSKDEIPGSYRKYRTEAGRLAAQRYDELMNSRESVLSAPGKKYTVDIPDDAVEKMLDWDKPLSEQTPYVQQAILKAQSRGDPLLAELLDMSPEGLMMQGMLPSAKGAALYKTIADDVGGADKASEFLRQAGIPGIRYLDGASRSSGKGTRNFVVFDDKLIKVLKKD